MLITSNSVANLEAAFDQVFGHKSRVTMMLSTKSLKLMVEIVDSNDEKVIVSYSEVHNYNLLESLINPNTVFHDVLVNCVKSVIDKELVDNKYAKLLVQRVKSIDPESLVE